jgi:hypothetical protein
MKTLRMRPVVIPLEENECAQERLSQTCIGVSVGFEYSYNSQLQPHSWMSALTGDPPRPLKAPPSNVGKIYAMFRSPINLKSLSKSFGRTICCYYRFLIRQSPVY